MIFESINNRSLNNILKTIVRNLAIVFSIFELLKKIINFFIGLFAGRDTTLSRINNLRRYYNIKKDKGKKNYKKYF
jgi:hypothetical protein